MSQNIGAEGNSVRGDEGERKRSKVDVAAQTAEEDDDDKVLVDLTLEDEEEGDEAEVDLETRPSQELEAYWIFAHNLPLLLSSASIMSDSGKVGKWLLFVSIEKLDETWAVIKRETEQGLLGIQSKTATAKANPNAKSPKVKVICVYTKDYDDVEDVIRVRERLRELGFTRKICYKTDEATNAGLYATGTNAGKVAKYRM